MSASQVSRRYAKALLAATKQKGAHHAALSQMKVLQEVVRNDAEVAAFFETPMISPDQKVESIQKALQGKGLSEDVVNLLSVLAEKQRLSRVGEIAEALERLIDEEDGVTRGIVRAAKPLAPEAQKQLEVKISSVLNRKIVLTFKEDPKVLGGVVANVGGWTFDDSIETHLRKLNEELNRSAN